MDSSALRGARSEDSRSFASIDDGGDRGLDRVLGLRCLSIVLSYLEECDGTSFLLCQKRYWTDTILPLLRLPPESRASKHQSAETKTKTKKKKKHRHRMSGRNGKPAVSIPDASVRLDRLNTRRWNARRRRPCDRGLTTAQIAEAEWEETLASHHRKQASDGNDDETAAETNGARPCSPRRFRSIMNPPLLRFYDGQSVPGSSAARCFKTGTTCLASYPRSGNTLLRSLLETATGFCTSSDTRPDRNLSVALAEKPPFFCGEGLAPNAEDSTLSPFLPPQSVGGGGGRNRNGNRNRNPRLPPPPICKTHWPERIGCHAYDCNRVVLLVRNPFDATDSYWHMSLTNTHTEKVAPSVTEEHLGFYTALVRHEILQVWMGFLDYYWRECARREIPLLLVRYEDLVLSPKRELRRILEFCCDSHRDGGEHWWKERLEEVTRDADSDRSSSSSAEKARYGYRSSSSTTGNATDDLEGGAAASTTVPSCSDCNSNSNNNNNNSHPSIGRSLRKGGNFSPSLLKAIHDLDDNGWLERLGYHVHLQGFPNNLDRLPPVPVLDLHGGDDDERRETSMTINVPDVSLELRPRDSPYGRNMTYWRRQRTEMDTRPFPTV